VTAAQTNTPATPWTVNCTSGGADEKPVCRMSQTLFTKETGQRVVAAIIQRKPEGEGYLLTLALPHGLYLPAGVEIWVDEGPRIAGVIETADQSGSYSRLELSSILTDAMRKGATLNIKVTSANRDEIILQLSLAGFAAAIDRI
jgi:invasion protein IalB